MIPTNAKIAATIDTFRENASEVRSQFISARAAIQNDSTRSDEWKSQKLAESKLRQSERLSELSGRESAFLAAAREELERTLFGVDANDNAAQIVAYRDAVERTEALSSEDAGKAERLYDQAVRSNDGTLMQALFQRATEMGWSGISERHLERYPSKRDAFEALERVDRIQEGIEGAADIFAYVPLG